MGARGKQGKAKKQRDERYRNLAHQYSPHSPQFGYS
jgi:hypothetical protein